MVRKSVVTVYVRHREDCPHKNQRNSGFYRGCECAKWLRYSGSACFCKARARQKPHKQHKLAADTRSWGNAEEKAQELQKRLDGGENGGSLPTTPDIKRQTIRQELEIYLSAKRSENISPSVQRKLNYQLGLFCTFLENRSNFFPSEITKQDVIEFRATWTGWSDMTAIKAQQNLRGFIRFACRENRTELLDSLKTIKETKQGKARRKPKPFSEQEIEKILEHTPEKLQTLVRFMVSTGLSIRDTVQLEKSQLAGGWLRIKRQKTDKDVRQRLNEALHAELLATLNGNPRYVFWSGSGMADSETKRLHTIMRGIMKTAGVYIQGDVFHRFRDTAVDFWLGQGWSITEVAAALGDTVAVCEKHYADLASKRMEDRLAKLPVRSWSATQ